MNLYSITASNVMQKKPHILVIGGPTASGKSTLAVALARQFDGEIISADSRQVYRGLNIGTGKITSREMRGIPHHLLDVANPQKTFTVAEFKHLAEHVIADISRRGKLPILCGGTGFYIDAVANGMLLPEVPPNKKLRRALEKKSSSALFTMLKKLDPARARTIDPHNPHRLIRAIEIAKKLGKVPTLVGENPYHVLKIAISRSSAELKEKIRRRLHVRMKKGMLAEARKLHKKGISWKRMEELGLEYKYMALYLQKKISKSEMLSRLETEIWHYAKRQMTWFKQDKRILWFTVDDKKKIEKVIVHFLKK